jgi:hypothetical protein
MVTEQSLGATGPLWDNEGVAYPLPYATSHGVGRAIADWARPAPAFTPFLCVGLILITMCRNLAG